MPETRPFHLLAADIGATFSRFARFSARAGKNTPELVLEKEHWFQTADFSSFSALVRALRQLPDSQAILCPDICCMALAPPGPVLKNICYPPHIPWIIDPVVVRQELGISSVFLLNDFVAQGYACLYARSFARNNFLEIRQIQPGEAVQNAPVAIVGAGSDLGKAVIIEDLCRVQPSEGGHSSFSFVGEEEYDFARFLQKITGFVDIENGMVLSGRGFAHLYAFHSGETVTPLEATSRVVETHKDAAASLLTLEWFARFYGRMCKNFALDSLALSGLYITGGMARRVPVLDQPAFAKALHSSPTQAALLQNLPVWHIQSQQAGLWGAAFFAARAAA